MKIILSRDRLFAAITLFVFLLLIVACDNGNDKSGVIRAAASCVTEPAGNYIHISQGDLFGITLRGWVPCTGGEGEVVICGPASFLATVNQNRFFSAGTLDEWHTGTLGVQRHLAMDTSSWLGTDRVIIEVTSDQTGSQVLARCNFNLTVSLPSPALSSPYVARGGSTCNPSLSIQWVRQTNNGSLAGYSYSVVNQDNPNYDAERFPDTTIDLDPGVMTFVTDPLDAGHTWEFNLLPIDTLGGTARFYSSFWASIEACSVEVTWPRDGDTYAPDEWVQLYWVLPILWEGNDVGGAYDVATVELLDKDGNAVVLSQNLPNTGNSGFSLPLTTPAGTGYRIRMTFIRNTDLIAELPLELIGMSGVFSVTQ